MRVAPAGVTVYGIFSNSSDKRLKFNVKSLTTALDVRTRLETIGYDQTYNLVDQYTPETPQSHHSGFIEQSAQKNNELKHAVEGGEIGEDGVDSIRTLNYNAIFTYAIKGIQELNQIAKALHVHIDELQAQLRTTCC